MSSAVVSAVCRRPSCWLRTRSDCALQVETRITCPLSAMQTFWYRRLLTRDSKMLTNIEAEDKANNKDKDKEVNVRL